jgi:hypothetical protein
MVENRDHRIDFIQKYRPKPLPELSEIEKAQSLATCETILQGDRFEGLEFVKVVDGMVNLLGGFDRSVYHDETSKDSVYLNDTEHNYALRFQVDRTSSPDDVKVRQQARILVEGENVDYVYSFQDQRDHRESGLREDIYVKKVVVESYASENEVVVYSCENRGKLPRTNTLSWEVGRKFCQGVLDTYKSSRLPSQQFSS